MHPAATVWQAAVFGPMLRSPGRTLLSVIVIALGVALGLAVHVINRTAADEISRAARSLFGLADFAIEARAGGFDERLYPQVARVAGVAAVSPVVEIQAKLADRRGTLKVLGMDAFRARELQPSLVNLAPTLSGGALTIGEQALVLSASAARDLELAVGDTIDLLVGTRRERFRIAGVLPGAALEDRAALTDIAMAQWKFDALGKLQRLNVRLAPGADAARVRRQIATLLPRAARIVTPGDSTDDALRLSRAYRTNLTALALVALFTGGFLVYSTQTLAVLRRRRELALLHALGVTHREQFWHTVASAMLVGLTGAAAGVALGSMVARYALRLTGGDLGAGYLRAALSELRLAPLELATFVALGTLVAVAGAAYPAQQATRIATAAALKSGDAVYTPVRAYGSVALVLALVAGALTFVPPIDGLPLAGYASIALVVLATLTAVPSLLQRLLAPLPSFASVPIELALSYLRGSGRYATLSVAAIVVSFSLMVAMLIMVTSFRSSLDAWTQKILPADLYLRVGYIEQSAFLDATQLDELASLHGVRRVASTRFARLVVDSNQPPVTIVARELDPENIEREIWLRARSARSIVDALPVWVSEAAADRYGWRAGMPIDLLLGAATVRAVVGGVWRDYEHPNGAILLQREHYVRLTGDTAINAMSFWLAPGVEIERVREQIRERLGTIEYELRTPRELRRLSLQVFDRTFAVTYVLEIVAIVIGLFGIAAGMSAQVLARHSEFGVLRHLGLTRVQIGRMLAIEGAMLGALGVLVGLSSGGVVSLLLIYVVNRQSFHWSMDLFVPVPALAACSVTLLGAAALIAVISGRGAMGDDVVRTVKEDW